MEASNKKVIVVAGPTAVGKTAIAVQLATLFNTEIISADSRQCYKEMRIGVARPTAVELSLVPHHFIASHTIQDQITAADFEKMALETCDRLFQSHDTVIMTGGTGLYIRAFAEGLDLIPEIPAHIREDLQEQYKLKGLTWLQESVRLADPEFYSVGETLNPQRMMRALEVVTFTGKSVLHFRTQKKKQRSFQIIPLALELPREQLVERINQRVDRMVSEGLEEEVRSLQAFRHLNALQTVGYREFFDYFDGLCTRDEAILQLKQHTRQYAKRQMTWFKKDLSYHWAPPSLEAVKQVLANDFLLRSG